jgi:alpha-mannosidase
MQETSAWAVGRIERTYRERVLPAVDARRVPASVTAWEVDGEPVPFEVARTQSYRRLRAGEHWGRPWGTTWLRVEGRVPEQGPPGAAWELRLDLGFLPAQPGFQAEGLVYDEDGGIIKAIEPRNDYVPIDTTSERSFVLFVEAASNPDIGADWTFRPTPLGDPGTAGDASLYVFRRADLVLRDAVAAALEADWRALQQLAKVLPAESTRRAGILHALQNASDVLDPDDVPGTAAAAREALCGALAAPASASSHRVTATGHAHIDSAWLWPVRETIRKCARTFSNALHLMDAYPEFVFVASSAQQYAWMKERYPALFERIRARVREGRWVPVGGMWVEADTNMPGGESLVRQFLAGKGFFLSEFGVETSEVWLPDSFGFSGTLPQIMAGAGADSFLTQKLSWNETNPMPHTSFLWEGIDGTRILTHFPPVATYNSDLSADDLARAERQHAQRGVSDASLVPFGYGDGGGGPTREMLELGVRKQNLEGSPRITFGRPDAFFDGIRRDLVDPPIWSGELYLEFHRGTYTSQARTKLGNRRCEHLLREAELWAATAAVRVGAAYPADELRRCWETVLLHQFHDILPGSSIAWVHEEAERRYGETIATLERLIADAVQALSQDRDDRPGAFNATPFSLDGVPALAAGPLSTPARRRARRSGDHVVLESEQLRAAFDDHGHLTSLVHKPSGREAVAAGDVGNELQLFRDIPNRWDAWNLDASYGRTRIETPLGEGAVRIADEGITVVRPVGNSSVEQVIRLSPAGDAVDIETRVDWRERQKLLKLAFAWDVHADTALSEIQFGYIRRPLHANTSWDMARFETCAHRWVRVEEPGFGVTVANDRVYGHDVMRRTRADGGTTTVLRDSLLRAPTFPDPGADRGRHTFRHSLVPGSFLAGVAVAYRLNCPPRERVGVQVDPLVAVDGEGVLVEGVKLAEDGSGDLVVRLYEAVGRQVRTRLAPRFPVARAVRTDLLERPLPAYPGDPLELRLRAFEIVTVRLERA